MEPENIFFFAGTAVALLHASVKFALNYRKNKAEEKKNYEEKVDVVQFIINELNSIGFNLSSEKAKEYVDKFDAIVSEDALSQFPRIKNIQETFSTLFEDIAPEGPKIVNAVLSDAVKDPQYYKLFNNFVNTPLFTRIKNNDLSKRNYIQPADITLNKQLSTLATSPNLFADYSPSFIFALVSWLHLFSTIRHHTTISRGQLTSELKTEFSNLLDILGNEKFDVSGLEESETSDLLILQLDIASHAQNAKILLSTYNKLTENGIESLEPETLLSVYHTSAILGKWDDVRASAKILRKSFPDFLERFKQASIKMRNVPDMSILTNLAEDFDFYDFAYATSKSEEEIQQNGQKYLIGYHKEQKREEKRKAKEAAQAEAEKERLEAEAAAKAADDSEAVENAEAVESVEPTETAESTEPTETVESGESSEVVEPSQPTEAVESAEPTEEAESADPTENVEAAEPTESESTEVAENPDSEDAVEDTESVPTEEATAVEEDDEEEEDDGYVPVVGGVAFEGPDQGPHPLTQREYSLPSYSYSEWAVREYTMNTLPERLEASDPVYLKSIQDDISRSNELKAKKGPLPMEKSTNVIHRMGCLAYMKSFSPVPIYPVGICTEDKMVFAAKINISSSLRPLLQSEYYEFTRDTEYVDEENNTQAWNGFMTLKQEFFSAEDKTTTTNKTSFYFTLRIIIAPKKKSKAITSTVTKKSKTSTKKSSTKSGKKTTSKSKTKSTKSTKPELREIAEGDDEENDEGEVAESTIDDSTIDSTIESNIDESNIDESNIDESNIDESNIDDSNIESINDNSTIEPNIESTIEESGNDPADHLITESEEPEQTEAPAEVDEKHEEIDSEEPVEGSEEQTAIEDVTETIEVSEPVEDVTEAVDAVEPVEDVAETVDTVESVEDDSQLLQEQIDDEAVKESNGQSEQ